MPSMKKRSLEFSLINDEGYGSRNLLKILWIEGLCLIKKNRQRIREWIPRITFKRIGGIVLSLHTNKL